MIQIITDSTSDITSEHAKELGIHIVSLLVHFGEESFRDGVDITNEEFYNKLAIADKLPTTTQINPDEFTTVFQKYIDDGDEIIGIFETADRWGQ